MGHNLYKWGATPELREQEMAVWCEIRLLEIDPNLCQIFKATLAQATHNLHPKLETGMRSAESHSSSCRGQHSGFVRMNSMESLIWGPQMVAPTNGHG